MMSKLTRTQQVQANRDPNIFPSPMEIRLNRPMDSYLQFGHGPHQCLGEGAAKTSLTAMLKTVAGKCENLRPAPGPQGQLKKIDRGDGFYAFMDANWSKFFPFPTSKWIICLRIIVQRILTFVRSVEVALR